MKYRKRPVVVEVVQFKGVWGKELKAWAARFPGCLDPIKNEDKGNKVTWVSVSKDPYSVCFAASKMDWIVLEYGEFRVVHPARFEMDYEPVEEGK